MSDERRDTERSPSFNYVKLTSTDADGNEKTFPVILRDRSGSGLGGMYIGQEVLSPQGEFLLRDPEGGEKKVRIVWTKRVADYVQMLGMELVES